MRLPSDKLIASRNTHFRHATKDLNKAIERGEISSAQFNSEQLKAIAAGDSTIPNLTWHHHQDIGRMQLIPTNVHEELGHIGGYSIWGAKK